MVSNMNELEITGRAAFKQRQSVTWSYFLFPSHRGTFVLRLLGLPSKEPQDMEKLCFIKVHKLYRVIFQNAHYFSLLDYTAM